MGKRFTETGKWNDKWFAKLSAEHKLFWVYLCDTCDQAGVWDEPLEQAAVRLGNHSFNFDEALKAFGDRVEILPNGAWWLVKFIDFQNPKGLSDTANFHKGIFASIEKNSIPWSRVGQGLVKSKSRGQDKDKDSLEFDSFWEAYPRKTAKDEARKAWSKVRPPLQACIDTLAWQSKQESWTKDGGQFIPYPATWINRGSWQDEVIKPVIEKRRCAL